MHRCLQLAQQGSGKVAPNPMVGAVLVHAGLIIGEGYHQKYGEGHAEVNCLKSVAAHNRQHIASATLYVCLEPCAHFGKTPPCTDLIIKHKIPKVIIGCMDIYAEVIGKGIAILREAGIHVIVGVLQKECLAMNARFFTYHQHKRPYIILKWAQSMDGNIAAEHKKPAAISGDVSNRLVHCWRTEEAAILVGTATALSDDPQLSARLWKGNNPVRLVTDSNLRLPLSLKLFDQINKTVVFNAKKREQAGNVFYYQLDEMSVKHILAACYDLQILSVIVEGGSTLLQSFIDAEAYDEIRVITNTALRLPGGYPSPKIKNVLLKKQEWHTSDLIGYYS